jgi:hypothetical protein
MQMVSSFLNFRNLKGFIISKLGEHSNIPLVTILSVSAFCSSLTAPVKLTRDAFVGPVYSCSYIALDLYIYIHPVQSCMFGFVRSWEVVQPFEAGICLTLFACFQNSRHS